MSKNKLKRFFKLDEYSDKVIEKNIKMEKKIDQILLNLDFKEIYDTYKNGNLDFI